MTQEPEPQEQVQTLTEVVAPHALELIERAQIDMQIATAKKYPRDLAVVKRKMLSFATLDEETAESCFYTLKRKNDDGTQKLIQGPSVRLAEIAVACYQNLRAASRIIDNDGKTITSQGACHDLENNTYVSVETKRRITNKRGQTYSEDMQVVTGNAANSIAFRNAVFKVVPGALVKPVYEAAKQVAVGNASTLSAKREKVLKRLNAMGADNPRILLTLGRTSIDTIDLGDLEVLIGLGTAIKDGDTSVDEAFPGTMQTATEASTEKLKTKLKDAQEKQQTRARKAATGGTESPQSGTSNGPAEAAEGEDPPTRPPESSGNSGEGPGEKAGTGEPVSAKPPAGLPTLDRLPSPATSKEGDWANVSGRIYQFLRESWMFYGNAPAPPPKFGDKPGPSGKHDAGDFA